MSSTPQGRGSSGSASRPIVTTSAGPGDRGRPVSGTVRDAADDPGGPPGSAALPGQDGRGRHTQAGQRATGTIAGGRELTPALCHGPGHDGRLLREQHDTGRIGERLGR